MSKKTTYRHADIFVCDKKIRVQAKHAVWYRDTVRYDRKYRQGISNWTYKPSDVNLHLTTCPGEILLRDILTNAGIKLPNDKQRQTKFKKDMIVLANVLLNMVIPILLEQDTHIYKNTKRKGLKDLELRLHTSKQYWPEGVGGSSINRVFNILEEEGVCVKFSGDKDTWSSDGYSLPTLIEATPDHIESLYRLGILTTDQRFRQTSYRTQTIPQPSPPLSLLTSLPKTLVASEMQLSSAFQKVVSCMEWCGDVVQKPTFYIKIGNTEEVADPTSAPEWMQETIHEIFDTNNRMNNYDIYYCNGSRLALSDIKMRVRLANIDSDEIQWSFGRTSCTFTTLDKGQKANLFFSQSMNEESRATEIDLSALYPTLFFAETGINLEKSYEHVARMITSHGSWPDKKTYDEARALAKIIINSMISSANEEKARMAIQSEINKIQYKENTQPIKVKDLITTIYEANPGLQDYLFSQTWAKIMNNHETILMSRIRKNLIGVGIPVISCYDAIYVPHIMADHAQEEMNKEYSEYIKEIQDKNNGK